VLDYHSILAKRRKLFDHLWDSHGFNNVRLTQIHTTEPLGSEPIAFEFEVAVEKLKLHKISGIDKIQTRNRTRSSEVYELINSIWNKEKSPEKWKESTIVPIYMKDDETDCSNYRGTLF
jgi:hypothetical protein